MLNKQVLLVLLLVACLSKSEIFDRIGSHLINLIQEAKVFNTCRVKSNQRISEAVLDEGDPNRGFIGCLEKHRDRTVIPVDMWI